MVKKDLGSARETGLVGSETSAGEMGLELSPGKKLKSAITGASRLAH